MGPLASRIADCTSKNAVSCSSARTTKRFPSRCRDSRLRYREQRDRNARARGRFQNRRFTTSHLSHFALILGIRGFVLSSVSMKDHVPQFAFSLDDRILNSDRSHCFSFPASGFLFGRIICNDRAEGEAPALNAFNLSKTCSLDKLPSKLPSNAAISRRTSGSFDRTIRTARAASIIGICKCCFFICKVGRRHHLQVAVMRRL